jgi:hypothetical protein
MPGARLRGAFRVIATVIFAIAVVVAVSPLVVKADSAQGARPAEPSFDVASVKPNMSGAIGQSSRPGACNAFAGSDGRGALHVTGGARPIEALVRALEPWVAQGLVDRPVIDRTGLTGTYDFDLWFAAPPSAAEPPARPDLPSIFTAVQEQLGLRLEPARAPLEFLSIERIERPTPD